MSIPPMNFSRDRELRDAVDAASITDLRKIALAAIDAMTMPGATSDEQDAALARLSIVITETGIDPADKRIAEADARHRAREKARALVANREAGR